MDMMNANLQKDSVNTQPVFARALADWARLYARYRSLRSISDTMACTSTHHPDHNTDMMIVEAEIDDLECFLEEATAHLALAADISLSDIGSILTVMETDLKIRHQISEPDITLLLITAVQRALQSSGSATYSLDHIDP